MGGPGSGDWLRLERRPIVEDCLDLEIAEFRKRLYPTAGGTIRWTIGDEEEGDEEEVASIGYSVSHDGDTWVVTLHYEWRQAAEAVLPIRLQASPTQFGHDRWWFTCPLSVNGKLCNRRVRKIYLPDDESHFGCRTCHGLTYRSSQTAHLLERAMAPVAIRLGLDKEAIREVAKILRRGPDY